MNSIATIVLLTLSLCQLSMAQTVTQTVVVTTTTSTTSIVQTFSICASIVNATAFCRRRRDYWIDAPVVIALDDDVDEQVSQFLKNPSSPFLVQPTQVPMQMRTYNVNDSDSSDGPISYSVIQPSMASSLSNNSRIADPFFFGPWANLFGSLLQRTRTVVTTITTTVTNTAKLFLTTGSKPIIIQGCIPSKLPFPNC